MGSFFWGRRESVLEREFPVVSEPVKCPGAFREEGATALLSRAALLLALGVLLRREYEDLRSDLQETAEEFPLPLSPEWVLLPGQSLASPRTLRRLRRLRGTEPEQVDRRMAELAERLYDESEPAFAAARSAAEFLVLGLAHREELIRVASAVSYLDVFTDPRPALWTLVGSSFSRGPEVAEIARTALASWRERGGPRRLGLMPSMEGGAGLAVWAADRALRLRAWRRRRRPRPLKGSGVMIHGTKLPRRVGARRRDPLWWEPQGDFHRYVLGNHCAGLYNGETPFSWGGNLSDDDRLRGAVDLCIWAGNHTKPISVFAHSHGGVLAMQASWPGCGRCVRRSEGTGPGLAIDKLVLLSCPIHWKHYQPCWENVESVFHVRVPVDLVVLADRLHNLFGSWTRLKLPQEALQRSNVSEHRISTRWFDHGASHDPQVWGDECISIP